MKAVDLREQSSEELQQTYEDALNELADLRVRRSKGDDSKQPLRIRSLRRDVARIKTLLRERETSNDG